VQRARGLTATTDGERQWMPPGKPLKRASRLDQ
jgi:hypothetical protein